MIKLTLGYFSSTLELLHRFNSVGLPLDTSSFCEMSFCQRHETRFDMLLSDALTFRRLVKLRCADTFRTHHTYGYMLEGRMCIVQCLLHCWPHRGTSLCSCRCGFWLAALRSGDLQTKEPFRMCSHCERPCSVVYSRLHTEKLCYVWLLWGSKMFLFSSTAAVFGLTTHRPEATGYSSVTKY